MLSKEAQKKIGKRIASTRMKQGLTLTNVSIRSGIPVDVLEQFETGNFEKCLAIHMRGIADALSIDIDILFSEEDARFEESSND